MHFNAKSTQNTKFFNNSKWIKVFYHDCSNKNFFINEDEAKYSLDPKKYSILGKIDEFHKNGSKYEFIIYWPQLNQYFQWRQSINPVEDIEQSINAYTVKGFEPIFPSTIPPEQYDYQFAGLVKTNIIDYTINSLLNGNPGIAAWHYSIGIYQNAKDYYIQNGMPAGAYVTTNIVSLWLLLQKNVTNEIRKYARFPLFTYILGFIYSEINV